MAVGTVLLVATSRSAARFIRRRRRNYKLLDRAINWIEQRSSGKVHRIIRRTRPRHRKGKATFKNDNG
ncbi:hypothetical protein [Polycladidibacter stylochi]|uniref:hypothetical protein n=1 Tax=Polycladidibacter stylochi TaxID=1807766 RepID=UPI001AD906CB|nr:hypothetical protein [Pseudovibrio stylochi]